MKGMDYQLRDNESDWEVKPASFRQYVMFSAPSGPLLLGWHWPHRTNQKRAVKLYIGICSSGNVAG
jgi:hypothetical protein